MLHPQIYRSMEMVQPRQGHSMPFYFVSAYPRLRGHYHYLAPLLTRHTFVARGLSTCRWAITNKLKLWLINI
jgi:hypothetical protein